MWGVSVISAEVLLASWGLGGALPLNRKLSPTEGDCVPGATSLLVTSDALQNPLRPTEERIH